MLESKITEQLKSLFGELKSNFTLQAKCPTDHPKREEMIELLNDVAATSSKIEVSMVDHEELTLSIIKDGDKSSIVFRAIPSGHEFSSLILAIVNLDGGGKNLPDEAMTQRIKSLPGYFNLTTYMLTSCPNCPDVVQSLNLVAIINPHIKHTIVDCALFTREVEELGIQSVPAVYADSEMFNVGRTSLADLVDKLEQKYGSEPNDAAPQSSTYDVLIAGAGPAGATAAIYLARKGLNVAVVAERIGGQVTQTTTIENIPSIITTTGAEIAEHLTTQMEHYGVKSLDNRVIEGVEIDGKVKRLYIKGSETIQAPTLIIATGAQWRKLSIPGEDEYMGRGVAFCPHCDGALFKDKRTIVVGGGNSGVEAAIDLAGICKEVTLIEFMPHLNADKALQERLHSLSNVTILTSHDLREILGNGKKVTAIKLQNRDDNATHTVDTDGIFIQIGLLANASPFDSIVPINERGEIIVDRNGRTSTAGVYAAGDVTDVSYKQIVISMGEGAKAALSAFEDNLVLA